MYALQMMKEQSSLIYSTANASAKNANTMEPSSKSKTANSNTTLQPSSNVQLPEPPTEAAVELLRLLIKWNKELPTKEKQIENILNNNVTKSNAPSLRAWKEQIRSISSNAKDFKRKIQKWIKTKNRAWSTIICKTSYQTR
jgi:hypothetical protein